MSREFIEKEIDQVLNEEGFQHPKNIAMMAAWLCAHFKAVNLKMYDVHEATTLADYFVICSVQNTMQAKTIAENLGQQARRLDQPVLSVEGYTDAEWILVDLGDVIIHIFQETSRDIYDLDRLWTKYPQVQIPESFYFSPIATQANNSSKTLGFF
jgi:ribosome-associated protein